MSSVRVVEDLYAAFARGDVDAVLGALDALVEWRQAEGNPYRPSGESWVGPAAVLENLFARLASEWDGFAVHPRSFHDAGEAVVVEARYTGRYKPTGRALDAQVCHVWRVRDGKVRTFQQYVDTAQLQRVMVAPGAGARS